MKPNAAELLRRAAPVGWVVEPLAREILAEYGLPLNRWAWACDPGAALEAARRIGYPVVVKVVSAEIVHKSDVGGVEVGVEGDDALRRTFERMARLPGFDGVVLGELARGVELIVGAKNDPQFGPVVLVGIGGTAVEIYQDVAIRMAPMTPADAASALDALRGRRLLEGFRGSPPADREALVDLLVRFSEMAHDLGPAVDSVDLNPVFCGPDGCVVADARIVLPGPKGPGQD